MKRYSCMLWVLCLVLCAGLGAALAEGGWTLPEDLRVIEAEAFMGVGEIEALTLPEMVERVESRAFANCVIGRVSLSEGVAYIADDAFDGSDIDEMTAVPWTYGYQWAIEHGYIVPPTLSVSLACDAEAILSGDVAVWTAQCDASGDARYTWRLNYGGETVLEQTTASPEYSFAPMFEGDYEMTVTARDQAGGVGQSEPLALTVSLRSDVAPAEDFTYAITGEAYITIKKYVGSDAHLVIPEQIEGYPVQVLAGSAFAGNTTLVSVELPDTVTEIGASAFKQCSALRNVRFGEGLTKIGREAFIKCSALQQAWLPDSVTNILYHAFMDCANLASFRYPVNDMSCGGSLFEGCPSLTRAVVPEGVTVVPSGMFAKASIEEVELPSTLKKINESAFSGCQNLESVDFPEGLETIGKNAFANMPLLTEALMPDSVKSIGYHAFQNCPKLARFGYPLNDEFKGGDALFIDCPLLTEIVVPEGVTKINGGVFAHSNQLNRIVLPDSLEEIAANAFSETGITEALLPDSVRLIGTGAWSNCANLTTFRYPLNNELATGSTGSNTKHRFNGCVSLKRIEIPEGVTQIPDGMFGRAEYLEEVVLPGTLKRIGAHAFSGCTGIAELPLPDGLEEIGANAFEGMNITEALLPDSVRLIGNGAWNNCANLTTFRYPMNNDLRTDSRGSIYKKHFGGCVSLKRIEVPEGVTQIPSGMFGGAEYLEELDLPMSLKVVGESAFRACTSLDHVYLSENVVTIKNGLGWHAFKETDTVMWCEYRTYALNFAKDKGIAYYYLSPDRVRTPSGTLYRGDTFPISGYARSSVNLNNVTATIWDSTGTTALQSVSINPQTTDYDLSGMISEGLHFETLALGSYRYTLDASTEISAERWADTSFNIVPQPLRIFLRDAVLPSGILHEDSAVLRGTVVSNYPITNVSAVVTDGNESQVAAASAAPGGQTYDISGMSGTLNLSGLPAGQYSLRITAEANGEIRVLAGSSFGPYGLDGAPSEDTRTAVLKFVQGNSKNINFFRTDYVTEALGGFSTGDMILMAVNSRKDWILDVVFSLKDGFEHFSYDDNGSVLLCQLPRYDGYSENRVRLYETELATMIAEMNLNKLELPKMDKTRKYIVDSVLDLTDINLDIWHQIDMDDHTTGNEVMDGIFYGYIKDSFIEYDTVVSTYKSVLKDVKISLDFAEEVANISCNYIQGLYVISMLADYIDQSDNPELQEAVERLNARYKSVTMNLVTGAAERMFKMIGDKGWKEITKAVFEEVSGNAFAGASTLYALVDMGVDVTLKITGLESEAKGHQDFMTQLDFYRGAVQTYQNAFLAIREGDTSDIAISRFVGAFNLAKYTCARVHNTMLDMESLTTIYQNWEKREAVMQYIRDVEKVGF